MTHIFNASINMWVCRVSSITMWVCRVSSARLDRRGLPAALRLSRVVDLDSFERTECNGHWECNRIKSATAHVSAGVTVREQPGSAIAVCITHIK